MEIKAELNKPYTEKERLDFIVSNNHQQGYEIQETETALEAWGYTQEELEQQERERINSLTLTPADVERALYKAKGIDFDDLKILIQQRMPNTDLKAVKIELNANMFYRSHPLINQVGELLGYSEEDMDYLFENKELPVKTEVE